MNDDRRALRVSVVIPALDAEATLGACLRALASQILPRSEFETIVVVDSRTVDRTADVAREAGAIVLINPGTGAATGRNAGIEVAQGRWVAFTDADCVPSRVWLSALLASVEAPSPDSTGPALGAAGATIGYRSDSPAARFVDLTGGLRAHRYLAHERYPWAPPANLLYRREALVATGGFDSRFDSYEGCDLHTRLLRQVGGAFRYVDSAVVLHRHRVGWRAYWRQQVGYGRGYAQFFRGYARELRWSPVSEARAWLVVLAAGLQAIWPARGDSALIRHGMFVKLFAQRVGFATTYWSRREAARWRDRPAATAESAP